jgi:hypothetical protein
LKERFKRKKKNETGIEDIYDGTVYKKLSLSGGPFIIGLVNMLMKGFVSPNYRPHKIMFSFNILCFYGSSFITR